jgi:hypothetical protein
MPRIALDEFLDDLRLWHERFEADEWHFVRLRQALASSLEPHEAFALIDDVVPHLLREKEDFPLQELGHLILELARRSSTAELPRVLERDWDQVVQRLRVDPGAMEELTRWYRRPVHRSRARIPNP